MAAKFEALDKGRVSPLEGPPPGPELALKGRCSSEEVPRRNIADPPLPPPPFLPGTVTSNSSLDSHTESIDELVAKRSPMDSQV